MEKKPAILIVDDEEIFRTFIADTLRFFGHDYSLQTAASGADALKIIEQDPADIDLVLLDVAMPPPNGFDVLKRIKENHLARQMKVIMLTATHQVENKIKAFSSGAADYISKPFEAEELIARIETQLTLKQSEEALRDSEARYRVLAENASDLITKITLEGIYTYVSPASLAVLGFAPEELVGQSYYDLIHPDDLIEINGMSPPLLDPTTSSVFAMRFKRNDGNYIWLETSIRTIHNKNIPTELIAVARDITERKIYESAVQRAYAELERRVEYRTDQLQKTNAQLTQEITERKRAEAALEEERASLTRRVEERTIELRAANEELSRAARLKDEFLASMSHELRTPLNAVLGMSEALQEQVYGPLNEMQLKSLATIEESGRHLLALINDILDLSKIEAGKLVLDITSTPVESICQASLRFVKQDAHKKRLKVSSIFDSQVRVIQVDERRLKQILVNLLSNAVKFTPEEGEIGLEVKGDPVARLAHFIVWDTGIGINPQNLDRLFQPFVQLDSRLSRRYSGTGLGLALVQRMVEMHYGKISVESEEGKGSRFIISLPWLPDGSDNFMANQVDEEDLPPLNLVNLHRALVIEDSPVVIDQYTRYFQELGIELAVHLRGSNVIEKAMAVQPDVIILDLLLPDQYGWDVLAELKKSPQLKHIPVIIASVTDERARGLAMGAAEYLIKPLSRARLQKALAQAIAPGKAKTSPPPAPAPVSRPGQSALILLAEDNQINIFTMSQYLKQKGYRLVLAQNGLEAIEQAQTESPDLILMDIQMPDMDGLEAIRRIKANPSLAGIPIIALTALAMAGDRERCLQAGANGYLSKPVNLKSLLQTIEAHLRKA